MQQRTLWRVCAVLLCGVAVIQDSIEGSFARRVLALQLLDLIGSGAKLL